WTAQDELRIVDIAGGEPREVIGDWRYEPGGIEWLPNGRILMTASIGGRSALIRIDPSSGAPEEVLGGRRRINGVSYDRKFTKVAYVATDLDEPTELYIANIDGTGERKLTTFNAELTDEVAFSDAERFTYESVGGLEIEAWLMKPYGYDASKQYPLVLYIHG